MARVAVPAFVSIGAVASGSSASSEAPGKPQSVAQLRSQITQMKEQLQAVKSDAKTDCKTKDWKMQSLQRAISQAEVQVNAKQASAAKQGKIADSDDDSDSSPPKPALASDGNVGTRVSCYA